MKRAPRVGLVTLAVVAGGCAAESGPVVPAEVPLYHTSAEPTLAIGEMEGADEYTFGSLGGLVRLPDGGVAVPDAQTGRISLYGADGAFRTAYGGSGEGPGEFRWLSRLYTVGDTILGLEAGAGRLLAFHPDGGYLSQRDVGVPSGDSTFAMDTWLHGRYWIDGATTPPERNAVRRALDRLPPPTGRAGYRFVRVTDDGDLWLREGRNAEGELWTVVAPDGTPTAMVETPPRFVPDVIAADEVTGRWRDANDVQYVRAFALEDTGRTVAPPAWMSAGVSADSVGSPPDEEEFREAIMGSLRGMASAQEIFYSQNYSYTSDVTRLGDRFEPPEEVVIDVVEGGTRGWAAVFAHPQLPYICGLSYGMTEAVGWTPGMVVCAPNPGTADAEGDA